MVGRLQRETTYTFSRPKPLIPFTNDSNLNDSKVAIHDVLVSFIVDNISECANWTQIMQGVKMVLKRNGIREYQIAKMYGKSQAYISKILNPKNYPEVSVKERSNFLKFILKLMVETQGFKYA